jgi:hypothetical protein
MVVIGSKYGHHRDLMVMFNCRSNKLDLGLAYNENMQEPKPLLSFHAGVCKGCSLQVLVSGASCHDTLIPTFNILKI